MSVRPSEDPNHPANSDRHHTGKLCIEQGCTNPAGTAWSPHWCQPCNAIRMNRISQHMEEAVSKFKDVETEGSKHVSTTDQSDSA